MRMSGEQSPSCPYGDRNCPKVEDVEHQMEQCRKSLAEMAKLLYIIAGILMVQLGVTII